MGYRIGTSSEVELTIKIKDGSFIHSEVPAGQGTQFPTLEHAQGWVEILEVLKPLMLLSDGNTKS